jgi:hypothetical protein
LPQHDPDDLLPADALPLLSLWMSPGAWMSEAK